MSPRINLVSDTVTRPTPAMRQAIAEAVVGDDVFGLDPTVNQLEAKVANLLGMEAAVFCPSGTMANQLAIKAHTDPLDEMIAEHRSHVCLYESAGYAFHSGISVRALSGKNGKLTASQVEDAIRPIDPHFAKSKLVVLENTCNRAGGTCYTLAEMKAVADLARSRDLKMHLDGARLMHALAATGDKPKEVGRCFDTVSLCLSKGLGAPVGSVLVGDTESIDKARRFRKVFGGGMRQAGILAAAGIYALDHHVDRLSDDIAHAKQLEKCLLDSDFVSKVQSVETNIVLFDVVPEAVIVVEKLKEAGVDCLAIDHRSIRLVTHLDISSTDITKTCDILQSLNI